MMANRMPPTEGKKMKQNAASLVLDKETQNCQTIATTFLLLVLPLLKQRVLHLIDFFTFLKSSPYNVRQTNYKQTLNERLPQFFKLPTDERTLENHNELARVHLSPMQQQNFTTIEECTDIRVLLTIITKTKCFPSVEVQRAQKLKDPVNKFAHNQVSKFSSDVTQQILQDIEDLFLSLPMNTEQEMRDLKQVKKYGSIALLLNRTGQQITEIRNSLEKSGLALDSSIRASIQATLTREEVKQVEIQLDETKMGGRWSKLPLLDLFTCVSFRPVSNTGNTGSLQSIISRKSPKYNKETGIGFDFKIAELPFAKGTSRVAYRGHFEPNQLQPEFYNCTEVVVKVSSQDASVFLEVDLYANAFAEEFSKLYEGPRINFSWIKMLKLDKFDGPQTIEPYLNRKMYRKW